MEESDIQVDNGQKFSRNDKIYPSINLSTSVTLHQDEVKEIYM